MQSTSFFKLLAETIKKEDYANLSFIRGEFLEDGSYSIIYKSQSHTVLLEFQSEVTKKSMKRSVEKCLEVIDHFGIQPLLFVLTGQSFLASEANVVTQFRNASFADFE